MGRRRYMDEQSNLLRILTVLGLGAGTIALTLNMCAMDRWEAQLIRTQDRLEELDKTVAAIASGGVASRPAAGTGAEWGRARGGGDARPEPGGERAGHRAAPRSRH